MPAQSKSGGGSNAAKIKLGVAVVCLLAGGVLIARTFLSGGTKVAGDVANLPPPPPPEERIKQAKTPEEQEALQEYFEETAETSKQSAPVGG